MQKQPSFRLYKLRQGRAHFSKKNFRKPYLQDKSSRQREEQVHLLLGFSRRINTAHFPLFAHALGFPEKRNSPFFGFRAVNPTYSTWACSKAPLKSGPLPRGGGENGRETDHRGKKSARRNAPSFPKCGAVLRGARQKKPSVHCTGKVTGGSSPSFSLFFIFPPQNGEIEGEGKGERDEMNIFPLETPVMGKLRTGEE